MIYLILYGYNINIPKASIWLQLYRITGRYGIVDTEDIYIIKFFLLLGLSITGVVIAVMMFHPKPTPTEKFCSDFKANNSKLSERQFTVDFYRYKLDCRY
jgi:hypothetical protein